MQGSTPRRPADQTASAPSPDLTLLVTTEQQLEQLLSQARVDAQAITDSARADVAATSAALDKELSEARARFQSDVEAERARRGADVLAEGRRQAAELDAIPDVRIAALAEVVLARLVRGVAG